MRDDLDFSQPLTCDVAIAGAGLAGLVAGAILTRHGQRVVVVDRNPEAGGRGLYAARRAAVKDTDDSLTRSIALKTLKTVGDLELYETSKVFQELASKDHKFPTKVKNVLLAKKIIRPVEMRPERHGNTDRFESDRTQVLHAMVEVLADLQLHPSCRKGGAVDGAVVGMDLARTFIANQQVLFDGGKSPLETETIAKLFNEIVPPQVR